jgi:hypothetical protein
LYWKLSFTTLVSLISSQFILLCTTLYLWSILLINNFHPFTINIEKTIWLLCSFDNLLIYNQDPTLSFN